MEYRTFGNTGLKVSVLGFGGSETGEARIYSLQYCYW